ncbi:MAG: PAS domain S-box protein [Bacteroidetes bacterium]|nr:PAS domain S-box protein [Bacteroidota bacterium]
MEIVNVLLIEDHEGEARLNQRLLERSHTMEFHFTNLRTLAEAQDALAHSMFDVLLLDLNLPDCKGVETFERLQEAAPQLPIVIISAIADERIATEAIRCGAQDYLVKGNITSEVMTRVVRYAMARKTHTSPFAIPVRSTTDYPLAVPFLVTQDDTLRIDMRHLAHLVDVEKAEQPLTLQQLIDGKDKARTELLLDRVRRGGSAEMITVLLASPAVAENAAVLLIVNPPRKRSDAALRGIFLPVATGLHAETDLAASEAKYRALVEHSQDGVFIIRDGLLLFVNRALADLTGYDPEEMVARPMTDFIAPEDRRNVTDRYERRMAGEDVPTRYEFSILHRSGHRRRVQLSVGRIPYEDDYAAMGTVKDVTEQQRIAYLLRIQHQLALDLAYASDAQTVQEHILNAVLRIESIDCAAVYALDHREGGYHCVLSRGVQDVHAELESSVTFHEEHERLIRQSATVFFPADEMKEMRGFAVLTAHGVQCMGIIPVIHGGAIIAALSVCSLTDSVCLPIVQQALESIASNLGGVLARLSAEEAMQDTDLLYRAVVDKSHDAIFIYRDDRLLFANERTMELTGYSREELLSSNPWSLIHPEDRPRIQEIATQRVSLSDTPIVYEGRVLTRDGTIRLGEFASTIIRYQQDLAALVTVRDITSRKSQEENLRRSDALLRSSGFAAARFLRSSDWESCIHEVLEHYGDAANVCRVLLMQNHRDPSGELCMKQRYVWVRREMRETLLESVPDGQSYSDAPFTRWAEELTAGRPIASVIDYLPDAEQIILARQSVRSTAFIPVFEGEEWWGFLRFDECRVRRTWLRPEIDAMQVAAETLGAAIHRKRSEEVILAARDRAEHADNIKKAFIANMSHEVRTPLNIILGYLVLVAELSGDSNEEVREFVQAIDDASQRLIRTVDSIMNISRFQMEDIALERVPLRFDKLVGNCVDSFRHLAEEKHLDLQFHNTCGHVELMADQHFLAESVEHLIDNAVKFTSRGSVTVRLDREPPTGVTLSVADTGIGISREFLERMYDPYMQEDIGYDRVYEGIGLGLTLVKLYLEAHGARIDVESRKGEGTIFSVTFPIDVIGTST